MDAIMQTVTSSPLLLVFFGAHFIGYSVIAWIVIAVRALSGRFTRLEWCLLAVFLSSLAVEYAQLVFQHDSVSAATQTYGLPRYFGVFAPFLWIWAAKALADFWSLAERPRVRIAVRTAIVALLGWFAAFVAFDEMRTIYCDGAPHDVMTAARKIAPVIRADYAGPKRQERTNSARHEYFSTRRPVVFSDMAAAAWLVRGQSEGANMKGCPYPDDYLFVRVGSGYNGRDKINPAVYDYVGCVKGDGTLWRLFRRKTTPSTSKK